MRLADFLVSLGNVKVFSLGLGFFAPNLGGEALLLGGLTSYPFLKPNNLLKLSRKGSSSLLPYFSRNCDFTTILSPRGHCDESDSVSNNKP